MKRFGWLWVAPVVLVLGWQIVPLASGERTLFLRDVLNTHLGLRSYFADALRRGELPLVDPLRAGGQGLIGNPNVVALYPDNLLLFVGSTLWQLNAHFWIHWLVALGAMFWLGRRWGLGREAAFAAGTIYAVSGYFVSQLNLYNAVAGAALAPALAAALLEATTPERRRRGAALFGLLWALELLAGDPVLALLALAVAVVLALPRALEARGRLPWVALALAFVAGTLVAAPQWVETVRLLPASFRGLWGNDAAIQAQATPDPRALIDLLLPMFFGRPDLRQIWSVAAFGGYPPLYFSLAPGALALALFVVGARVRASGRGAALGLLIAGGLLAYSRGLPAAWLADLPGGGLFRYSVKFVMLAAIAGALLAGRGFERALADEEARAALRRALLLVLGAEVALLLLFAVRGNLLEVPFRALFAVGLSEAQFAELRFGWGKTALVQAASAGAALLLVRALGRPRWGGPAAAALLTLHAAVQVAALDPMLPTDEAATYRREPTAVALLPPEAVLAHGAINDLFGRNLFEGGSYPDAHLYWIQRRGHDQLYGASGLAAGRRFELNFSPEGLDSFLVQVLALGLRPQTERQRVQALAATGVDRLLMPRPLQAEALEGVTLEQTTAESNPLFVYRIERPLEDAQLLGNVDYAPSVNVAVGRLGGEEFDPRAEAVVAGSGTTRRGPAGTARLQRFAAEEIALEAESEQGGVVVVRRAWLPLWRATIDGLPATPVVANVTRLAVELPPGRHQVRFYVDRAPLRWALAAAVAGLISLALLARWRVRGDERAAAAIEARTTG